MKKRFFTVVNRIVENMASLRERYGALTARATQTIYGRQINFARGPRTIQFLSFVVVVICGINAPYRSLLQPLARSATGVP